MKNLKQQKTIINTVKTYKAKSGFTITVVPLQKEIIEKHKAFHRGRVDKINCMTVVASLGRLNRKVGGTIDTGFIAKIIGVTKRSVDSYLTQMVGHKIIYYVSSKFKIGVFKRTYKFACKLLQNHYTIRVLRLSYKHVKNSEKFLKTMSAKSMKRYKKLIMRQREFNKLAVGLTKRLLDREVLVHIKNAKMVYTTRKTTRLVFVDRRFYLDKLKAICAIISKLVCLYGRDYKDLAVDIAKYVDDLYQTIAKRHGREIFLYDDSPHQRYSLGEAGGVFAKMISFLNNIAYDKMKYNIRKSGRVCNIKYRQFAKVATQRNPKKTWYDQFQPLLNFRKTAELFNYKKILPFIKKVGVSLSYSHYHHKIKFKGYSKEFGNIYEIFEESAYV